MPLSTACVITEPTAEGDWNSLCICSDGSYGVEEGLISSFPMRNTGGELAIVRTPINEFSRAKLTQQSTS